MEAERRGLKLRYGNSAFRAGQLFRKDLFRAVDDRDGYDAPSQLEGGVERLRQAFGYTRLDQEAVDNDFDVVILAPVEAGRVVERGEDPGNARTGEPGAGHFVELFAGFSLTGADDGSEHHGAVPVARP